MAKEILQLNIASTSTIAYDTIPYAGYDYNANFHIYGNDIILQDEDYWIAHNGAQSQSNKMHNDVIVNGIVISGWDINGVVTSPINTEIDLGNRKIYIPPRKVDNVYVEQDPVSMITFTNTTTTIQPYFDGVAYGRWIRPSSDFFTISSVSVDLKPQSRTVRTFYSAAQLQYKAQWEYSQYPIFAAALNSMQYGAMCISPTELFSAISSSNNSRYNYDCFSTYEYIEDLWLIPFASDDEYNAAYAVYYTWDDSVIDLINEFG